MTCELCKTGGHQTLRVVLVPDGRPHRPCHELWACPGCMTARRSLGEGIAANTRHVPVLEGPP